MEKKESRHWDRGTTGLRVCSNLQRVDYAYSVLSPGKQ